MSELYIRNIEDAWIILRECGDLVAQAASTVPHSLQIAQSGSGGGEGAEDQKTMTEPVEKHSMDTAETNHSKVR